MEEISVNDYIRLKDGYIRKYIKRSLDNHIILDEVYEGFKYLTSIEEKEEIVKHSPNIIDLIEVGDYVNGKEVLRINDYGDFKRVDFNLDYDDCDAVYNEDIKSIVTKEMMKSIEYRIN